MQTEEKLHELSTYGQSETESMNAMDLKYFAL